MDEPLLVAALSFIGVLALTMGVATRLGSKPAAVTRRLADHNVQVASNDGQRIERIKVLKEPAYSGAPRFDAVLRRFRPARTAARELIFANLEIGVATYLFGRLLAGLALGAGLWLGTGNLLVGLVAGVAGLMLPRLLVRRIASRRRAAFEGQLAEAIDLLVGALRAGYGFLQAIESSGREMRDPMRSELARVIEQVNVGGNAVEALQEMSARIESYDLRLFTAAVAVQRQSGGNLAEVLENLAETVRERRRVRGEVQAMTTGPRVSGYVLGAIPVGLLLYFVAVSASYRAQMLGTTIGRVMLAAAAIWSLIGFLIAQKVAKVEY